MKKNILYLSLLAVLSIVYISFSQTVDAYEDNSKEEKKGLFDPSKFSINHSVSFGMSSSSQTSGLKSQSLYTTMMTYKFSKPVTLNLNFGLPIHSTYNSGNNLNYNNIQSLDYFKNMPLSASVTWQPSEKFTLQVSFMQNAGGYSNNGYYSPFYNGMTPHAGGLFPSQRRDNLEKNRGKENKEEKE